MDGTIAVPRAAGMVPARRTLDGWRLLLVRRRRSWDFPNGSIAPTEDPILGARRETVRETGLDTFHFQFGEVFRDPAPYARGKLPRYYIAVTEQEAPDGPAPDSGMARWATFEEASDLLPQRLVPVLNWARRVLSDSKW